MKATLLKYRELGVKSLMQFKAWLSLTQPAFDEQTLSAPSLMVAEAKNAQGETVAFCTIEPVLLISTYVVNPEASPEAAQRAGDYINRAIESEAQLRRMSKCLLVAPRGYKIKTGDGGTIVPVIEQTVSQNSNLGLICLTPSTELSHYIH